MSSQINSTKPTSGSALTSDVRSNFGHAASELNFFFRMTQEYKSTTGGPIDYQVAFDDAITLVQGDRFTIQIQNIAGKTNTTTAPRLSVDAGNNFYVIKSTTGQPLNIGDLQQNGIYDIFWDGANFRAVNVFREDDALFTAILGVTYPVDSIIHSKSSTNPGTSGYFYTGVSFGTWQLYSQGKSIAGIDLGLNYPNTGSAGEANVSSASIVSSTDTMTVTLAYLHAISVGDTVRLSGFNAIGGFDPNGDRVVTAIPTTSSFSFEATGTTGDPDAPGTDRKVVHTLFNSNQESQGRTRVTLDVEEMPSHRHREGIPRDSFGDGNQHSLFANSGDDEGIQYLYQTKYAGGTGDDGDGDLTSPGATKSHFNMHPYVVTYIWVRTA